MGVKTHDKAPGAPAIPKVAPVAPKPKAPVKTQEIAPSDIHWANMIRRAHFKSHAYHGVFALEPGDPVTVRCGCGESLKLNAGQAMGAK